MLCVIKTGSTVDLPLSTTNAIYAESRAHQIGASARYTMTTKRFRVSSVSRTTQVVNAISENTAVRPITFSF